MLKSIFTRLAIIRFLLLFPAFIVCVSLYFVVAETKKFSVISIICWIHRASNLDFIEKLIVKFIKKNLILPGKNKIRELFAVSSVSIATKARYKFDDDDLTDTRLNYFRDLIVLKSPTEQERGSLLVKYTPTFDAFILFSNIESVIARYYLILEPSWSGYCDPSILMFISNMNDKVVVQSPEPRDFEFIKDLDTNLVPVTIGAADWVDTDIFTENCCLNRKYDLVMVANWARHKNHRYLFKALRRIKDRSLNVLLIGFPWGGRSSADIRKEMRILSGGHTVALLERLNASEVASMLAMSKVFLLLSCKEGPNKAVVEAFFSDVPAIVYEKIIGGAREKINDQTGILSSFHDLDRSILYMIENHTKFSPRAWALKNTGSSISTARMDALLAGIAHANGEAWATAIVEKVNSPNLEYKSRKTRLLFSQDYEDLKSGALRFHNNS